MIKYEGIENKYLYNKQILDKIIEIIKLKEYLFEGECTKESIELIVNKVNSFLNSITSVEQKVMLERHETEEEAREYFKEDFIQKFDKLMTILDNEQTIVALHGTSITNCPSICENGLQYKYPSLTSTAILQTMAYGQSNIHYNDYESLLNWKHHQYKGIIVVAVPYECFYKEGLWRKYQNTDSAAYGGQDYKIDSDFIVGYIDVEEKNIILNPRYNRNHNYDYYLKDNDIFHLQNNMNNATFRNLMIEEQNKLTNIASIQKEENNLKKSQIDVSQIPLLIEDTLGAFNMIKNSLSNEISEDKYKFLLKEISNNFKLIQDILPKLKTNEQVKLEKEEERKLIEYNQTLYQKEDDLTWEQWDNVEWEETFEEKKK